MAQVHLNQEDIKALEQTRQRLFQLTNNIQSLKQDVIRSNPLPQWSALPEAFYVICSSCCEHANNRRAGPPYKPPHQSWQRTSRVSQPTCQRILICSVEQSCTHLRIILAAHKKG